MAEIPRLLGQVGACSTVEGVCALVGLIREVFVQIDLNTDGSTAGVEEGRFI